MERVAADGASPCANTTSRMSRENDYHKLLLLISWPVKGEEGLASQSLTFHCHWRHSDRVSALSPILSIDLLIDPMRATEALEDDFLSDIQTQTMDLNSNLSISAQRKYLIELLRTNADVTHGADPTSLALTLVFARQTGYLARSDIFDLRLKGSSHFKSLTSFTTPLQACASPPCFSDETDLFDLVDSAIAILELSKPTNSPVSYQETFDRAANDLMMRFQLACFTKSPIKRYKVALVEGRQSVKSGLPVYQAAMALGMDLIIIDEEGHWLQEQSELSVKYRQHFLKADIMKVDDTLPERIAKAIRSLDDPIDGIFTVSDRHLVPVARAAEKLGLPTMNPRSYETSANKYESRLLQEDHGLVHLISTTQEVEGLIEAWRSSNQAPKYPLIVKPTMGWSSECVFKVANAEELLNAVDKATSRHDTPAVIESYISGIEIDVNFILCEGEILFVEIVDELPTTAENPDMELPATFLEQGLTQPSQLSQAEQRSATNTLYDLLLKCEFHTGCFHVEARLEDPSIGTIDSNINQHTRRCRLIEINARPMGFTATLATTYTYGVDFYAARLLSAVGDYERLRALSRPFSHTAPGSGAQFWLHSVYISASRGGIVRTEDAIGNLLKSLPHASKYIIDSMSFFEAGDVVPDPSSGVLCFLACFMVASTHSAAEAERIGDEIRENFSVSLEHGG